LHTGTYAERFAEAPQDQAGLDRLVRAAGMAHQLGIKVNAGHGLNYENVARLWAVPHLVELNIGHSIISRAIATGLETAVREMLRLMSTYPG